MLFDNYGFTDEELSNEDFDPRIYIINLCESTIGLPITIWVQARYPTIKHKPIMIGIANGEQLQEDETTCYFNLIENENELEFVYVGENRLPTDIYIKAKEWVTKKYKHIVRFWDEGDSMSTGKFFDDIKNDTF
jgi:hypothetical protein